MDFKRLARSKSFWTGVVGVVGGIGLLFTDENRNEGVQAIFAGLAIIFMRDAIAKTE